MAIDYDSITSDLITAKSNIADLRDDLAIYTTTINARIVDVQNCIAAIVQAEYIIQQALKERAAIIAKILAIQEEVGGFPIYNRDQLLALI